MTNNNTDEPKVVLTKEVKQTLNFIQDYGYLWMSEVVNKAIAHIVSTYHAEGGDEKQILKLIGELNSMKEHIVTLAPEREEVHHDN